MSKQTEAKTEALSLSNLTMHSQLDSITAGLIGNNEKKTWEELNKLKSQIEDLEANIKITFSL